MMVRGMRICYFNSCWVWPELEMTPGSQQKLLGPGGLLLNVGTLYLFHPLPWSTCLGLPRTYFFIAFVKRHFTVVVKSTDLS